MAALLSASSVATPRFFFVVVFLLIPPRTPSASSVSMAVAAPSAPGTRGRSAPHFFSFFGLAATPAAAASSLLSAARLDARSSTACRAPSELATACSLLVCSTSRAWSAATTASFSRLCVRRSLLRLERIDRPIVQVYCVQRASERASDGRCGG